MKTIIKINVLILCFLLFLTFNLFADFRFDLAANLSFYSGFDLTRLDATGNTILEPGLQPFPEAGLHYMIKLGDLNIGAGIRLFTIVLETIAWPDIIVELELDPIVISAELGGGAFAAFGFISNAASISPTILGDIAVDIKVIDWLKLGVGAFVIGENDPNVTLSDPGVFPISVYAFGKYSLNF